MITLIDAKIFNVFDFGLTGVFLFIDSIIYSVIGKLFDSFVFLADAEALFQNTAYDEIVKRIEVVIGVVMLFFVASALLKAIVDPENLNKGAGKIAKNSIISIMLLGIVPIIFDYAFQLQHLIISENVIGTLLFGKEDSESRVEKPKVKEYGYKMSLNILEVFLEIPGNTQHEEPNGILWDDVRDGIERTGEFKDITIFVEPIKEEENGIKYTPLVSAACGIFLIYVLLSFCIDLGIRVVKLIFYQIIAPIPILMYIIPEKKSVFDNWVKATLATYLEVFIRIFVMYTVVFLAGSIF